ncbi:MAG: UDP-N-acetylmuramoyl-tripeptide--D-alanyl-D-alanine ligase [Bacteroidetes bacterium]|nr:UDP-N-acetylmuramoyl-tripeptide--D-alanyl-D-alanine ligase [Bacteroidota bacterium]
MTIQELYERVFLKHPIICTDTRKIKQGGLFFALKGPNFNANTFAKQAIEQGSAFAIVDEPDVVLNEKYILVNDVLTTLQDLARYHRSVLQIPVIAIAGSNGKTTTKELMSAVLKKQYNTYSTPGNLNNHIGVALCILEIKADHQLAVIELGANHAGENAFLCTIAQPNFGIVTNNGKDHLEGFGSIEGVIASNNELYDYLKTKNGFAFVNEDDSVLNTLSKQLKRITYGVSQDSSVRGNVTGNQPFLHVDVFLRYAHSLPSQVGIRTNLIGKYNLPNILAAVAVGHYFEVSNELIKSAIEEYVPSNNRSQVIKTPKNVLFMDAYNANPSSMSAAIESFVEIESPSKIVIVGDMLEMGSFSESEHEEMVRFMQSKKLQTVFLVGNEFGKTAAPSTYKKFATTKALADWIKENPILDSTILLKGSRGIRLEELKEVL